jgi:hypothetical protein
VGKKLRFDINGVYLDSVEVPDEEPKGDPKESQEVTQA